MSSRLVLAIFSFWCCSASAQVSSPDPYNPQPLPDDVVLPLPGSASIVFRAVLVPGPEFWGDPERRVRLGALTDREPDNDDVFETPRDVMVAGSFPAPDGKNWLYHLGKYEVSKAQYVAVMGKGVEANGMRALADASGNPDDAKLATMTPDAHARELAQPVAWISLSAAQQFIDEANRWCFSNPQCVAVMPKYDGVPGLFRLPTEVEWEYAARGGMAALREKPNAEVFAQRLPFPGDQWEKFANAGPKAQGRTRRIGSLAATHGGFHDLFGNVQELTLGPFQPEPGQGKPGGVAARGGSLNTEPRHLRSSLRSEFEIFRWNGTRMLEQRSPATGLRLAIGSMVLPKAETRKQIVAAYDSYRQQMQAATPIMTTQSLPVIQAAGPLRTASAILSSLPANTPIPAQTVALVNNLLVEAQANLDQAAMESCYANAVEAVHAVKEHGRDTFYIQSREGCGRNHAIAPCPGRADAGIHHSGPRCYPLVRGRPRGEVRNLRPPSPAIYALRQRHNVVGAGAPGPTREGRAGPGGAGLAEKPLSVRPGRSRRLAARADRANRKRSSLEVIRCCL